MVSAPDGSVYAGSGNEGQVYRDRRRRARASVFFDTEELEVHAIALAPGGGIYVGTSPDGKIYKVDASGKGDGASSIPPTATSGASPSIAPATSSPATGDKGMIYKITPDGKGAPFYETKATHAMTLAFDREGRLLAGTESPGRVFRIDASGKPFVLLDSQLQRDPHAARRRRRQHLRGRGERPRRRRRRRAPPRPTPRSRRRSRSPSVSTEITVDRDRRRRRPRRRRPRTPTPRATRARRPARCSASCRTARGIWSGSRARTRRTTSPSSRAAAPARRHRQQGQDLPARPAIRSSRRSSRAPTRSR